MLKKSPQRIYIALILLASTLVCSATMAADKESADDSPDENADAILQTVGTESAVGSGYFSQDLSYNGIGSLFRWNADGSFSRVSQSQASGPSIVDQTYRLGGGFGFENQQLLAETRLSVSTTPKEKLSVLSPSLYVGRRWHWGDRSLRSKLTGDFDLYRQESETTTTRRRAGTTVTRATTVTLMGFSPGIDLSGDILTWLGWSAVYRYTFFGRKFGTLTNRLDTLKFGARQKNAGNPNDSTLFADQYLATGLYFTVLKNLELSAESTFDRIHTTETWSKSLRLEAQLQPRTWINILVGYERSLKWANDKSDLGRIGIGLDF